MLEPESIVCNTCPMILLLLTGYGCYCAYSFSIVAADKWNRILITNKRYKYFYVKESYEWLLYLQKRRTPNVWLYFNMIIQGQSSTKKKKKKKGIMWTKTLSNKKKSNKNRQKSTVLKHFTVNWSVANCHYSPERGRGSSEWYNDHWGTWLKSKGGINAEFSL